MNRSVYIHPLEEEYPNPKPQLITKKLERRKTRGDLYSLSNHYLFETHSIFETDDLTEERLTFTSTRSSSKIDLDV
jgi:hypothetical protein